MNTHFVSVKRDFGFDFEWFKIGRIERIKKDAPLGLYLLAIAIYEDDGARLKSHIVDRHLICKCITKAPATLILLIDNAVR